MTIELEIFEATLTKNICTVAYSLQDEQGSADVNQQISTDKLIEYVEANELNLETFFDPKQMNLECDGMDERYVDPFEYLQANTFSVVKAYIEGNLS